MGERVAEVSWEAGRCARGALLEVARAGATVEKVGQEGAVKTTKQILFERVLLENSVSYFVFFIYVFSSSNYLCFKLVLKPPFPLTSLK